MLTVCAHADEDTNVDTGPFAKLSTAGAITLFADYKIVKQFCQWCQFMSRGVPNWFPFNFLTIVKNFL